MSTTKEAIILAGGLGTRLRSVISEIPKPMAEVNGKPFLHYLFKYLNHFDYSRVILSVGFKSEIIEKYFDSEYLGMEIIYSHEKEPLGTGGGINNALKSAITDHPLILNGDTFFDIDLEEFRKGHMEMQAECSLALRNVENASRYGTVKTDAQNRIVNFMEKGEETAETGYINGGIYLLNKSIFERTDFPQKFSLEKDYFEKYYRDQKFCGFKYKGYFIDIGIPDDYHKAQNDFKGFKY